MKKKICSVDYVEIKKLYKFLDLGLQSPSDQFLDVKQIEKNLYYPLGVNTYLK